MITSLGREDNINELVRNYGMVIVDECHHAAAVTHENVLRAVTARYVYGMSATINRGDKQDKKMFMQLGPIRHRYTAKERAQNVSSNFVSADFRKMRTDSFQKSRTTRFRKIRVVR